MILFRLSTTKLRTSERSRKLKKLTNHNSIEKQQCLTRQYDVWNAGWRLRRLRLLHLTLLTLTLTAAAPEKLAADVAHRPGNAAVPGRSGVVGVTAALDVVGVKVVGVAHAGRGRRAPEEAHHLAHRLEIEKGRVVSFAV